MAALKFIKHWNCNEFKIQLNRFNLSLIFIYKDIDKNLKNLIFQFNRFENGNVDIFVSLFKKYQIEINGITAKTGKRKFYGIN